MNLLTACLYDPAAAVTKATSALLAMTAVDTTNLRNTFTVPPGGRVRVRMACTIHGATTFPAILLGVLNGATVVARVAPLQVFGNTATAFATCVAEFIVTGLTPGASLTWDAAYGVETVVAATGIKYGGPNDTTANNAFGAFVFEVWDPSPIFLSAAVPTASVDSKLTAIKAKTDSLTFTTALKVDAAMNAAADFPQAAADKVWSTATRALTDKVGFALSAAGVQAIWDALTSALTTASSIGKLLVDNINATISSRSTYAGGAVASVTAGVTVTTNNDKTGYALSAAGVQAIWDALTAALTTVGSVGKRIADNLDAAVTSRMATFTLPTNFSALSITAGGLVDITQTAADKVWGTVARTLTAISDSAGVTTLLARLTGTRATNLDNLDATVSSRSTYAGADTAGTSTLLSRVPSLVPVAADYTAVRAGKLDNLDVAVSSVSGGGGGGGVTPAILDAAVNPPERRRVVASQTTRRL